MEQEEGAAYWDVDKGSGDLAGAPVVCGAGGECAVAVGVSVIEMEVGVSLTVSFHLEAPQQSLEPNQPDCAVL